MKKNERMIDLRESLNLTQEEVAAGTELSQSMISRIEKGEKEPRKMNKIKIISFFNEKLAKKGLDLISMQWLFYEESNDLKSYLIPTGTE